MGEDFAGRCWNVQVLSTGAAIEQQREERKRAEDARTLEKLATDESRFLGALDQLDPNRQGASVRKVRDVAGLSGARCEQILARLRERGIVEMVPGFKASNGRDAEGVRRTEDEQVLS